MFIFIKLGNCFAERGKLGGDILHGIGNVLAGLNVDDAVMGDAQLCFEAELLEHTDGIAYGKGVTILWLCAAVGGDTEVHDHGQGFQIVSVAQLIEPCL